MLRGASAAIALPLLDIMDCKQVRAAAPPSAKRAAYIYFPNGVSNGTFDARRTDSSGKLQALSEWLAPFDSLKDKLTLPKNLWTPRGNGHGAGTATWLTGHGYDGRRIDAGGPSVDQIAAKAIGDQTLLPSLEISAEGEGFFSNSLNRNTISWADGQTPMPRDTSPRVIFDRMFRAGSGGLSERSVLDSILEDARGMLRKASSEDRKKIDEYLQSIRSLERRLNFADRQKSAASQNPALAKGLVRPPTTIPSDHGEYLRSMFDLIVLAFWSDATRISTFMLDHGQSNRYFNFIDGVQGTWHALSHWKDASGKTSDDDGVTSWNSVAEKRQQYNAVVRWHNEQVAYFLKRLESIDENGKSLLDRSMIVYGSSLSDGHEHGAKNLPVLVAGGSASALKTGREIKYRRPHSMSHLHLTVLRHLGIERNRFADADEAMGELF